MQEVWDAFGRGDIWGALERTLGSVLAGFYALIPIYGVSIILLTIAVRLLVWPLTSKQAKSMLAMQKVQPEVKRIQAKYKGDRQKLNEEMMKFYQENRINPLASCLPLLVQAPILFALFRVFAPPRGNGHFFEEATRLVSGQAPTCGGLTPRGIHGLIPSTSSLRESLDCNTQTFFSMDLAKRPADFLKVFPDVIPYLLLVAVVVATGIFSQRQMAKRTPASAMNDQMAMIAKIMPIFFGFISFTLSAGLGVYFAVSNMWQSGQQEMIFRQRQKAEAAEKAQGRAAKTGSGVPPRPPRRSLFSRLSAGMGMGAPPAEGNGAGAREASRPRRTAGEARAGKSGEATRDATAPEASRDATAPEADAAAAESTTEPVRRPKAPPARSAGDPAPARSARGTGGGSRPADPQRNRKKRKKKGR